VNIGVKEKVKAAAFLTPPQLNVKALSLEDPSKVAKLISFSDEELSTVPKLQLAVDYISIRCYWFQKQFEYYIRWLVFFCHIYYLIVTPFDNLQKELRYGTKSSKIAGLRHE
jgi:hypothetical protein